MSDSVALSTLRTTARREASMETGGPCSDPEWNDAINDGIRNLWDEASLAGEEWTTRGTTLSTTAGQQYVTLPSDWYRLGTVLHKEASDEIGRLLVRVDPSVLLGDTTQGQPRWYALVTNNVAQQMWIGPLPDAVYRLVILYHTKAPVLSADGDTFDFISGWQRYVTRYAAAYACRKEGVLDQAAVLDAYAQRELDGIRRILQRRDAGQAPRMRMIGDVVDGRRGRYPDSYWGPDWEW